MTPACGPHHRCNRETFGQFVQHNRYEDQDSKLRAYQCGDGDGDSVKECVHYQSAKPRQSRVMLEHRRLMSLLTEMKVRRNGVFNKLNQQVSAEQPHHWNKRGPGPLLDRFRNDLQEYSSQHEACAECDKVPERCLPDLSR